METNTSFFKKNTDFVTDTTSTRGEVSTYENMRTYLSKKVSEGYFELLDIFNKQFRDRYEMEFEGYEIGGTIGGHSGNSFYITDLALVDIVLAPVFSEYGKTEEGWEWIKENVLDPEISPEAPTFAKRATIPLLLEKLASDEERTQEEAEVYLEDLIELRKGIPSAREVIFSKLRGYIDDIGADTLISFIERDIALVEESQDQKRPTNVFTVILLFKLIAEDNNTAKQILLDLLDSEAYLEWDSRTYHTLAHFHILSNQPDLQWELLKEALEKTIWVEEMEQESFTSGDIQRVVDDILLNKTKETENDLEYLSDWEEEGLEIRYIVKALHKLAEEYPFEVIDYLEERDPLEGSIEDLEKHFPDPYTREMCVELAKVLAKQQTSYQDENQQDERSQLANKALDIIDTFIKDSDPPPQSEEHKRIESGEDVNIITSVRGRVAWALQQLANYKHILPEVYEKTKQLLEVEMLEVENLYVVQQALIPLSLIAANCHLFLEQEQRDDLHEVLFNLLEKHHRTPALASRLLRVFGNYRRYLDEEGAREVLEKLGHLEECAALFVYFAVYKKDEDFSSETFQNLLEEKIKEGAPELRQKISWHFWVTVDDEIKELENLKRYIDILSESEYNPNLFANLDHIIELAVETNEYLGQGIRWFDKSLGKRLGYLEDNVDNIEQLQNRAQWMNYERIFRNIAEKSPEDYLPLLRTTIEIIEAGPVSFHDVKQSFQASQLNENLQSQENKEELDSLWERVKEQYPRADKTWKDVDNGVD